MDDSPRPTKRPCLTEIPEYCFEPLEHERSIRILVLSPAMHDSDPLVAQIDQRNRRTNEGQYELQNYDAVSYVWGKAIFSHTLLCNGAHIAITENVDQMLRRFRRCRDDRRLWVDVICLNQADSGEKQQQVPLMREIYQEASRVLVWLNAGHSDDIAAVRRLGVCALSGRLGLSLDDSLILSHSSDFSQSEETLDVFFRNPWFTRRWVLHEVTAHPVTIVYYGSAKISWAELLNAADFLKFATNEPDVKAVLQKIQALGVKHDNILDLLWNFHDAACSENRDRIDALIGLASDVPWRPNYDRTWAQEYERFARNALDYGHFETIGRHLVAFGRLCEEVTSCPSWVPDWSKDRNCAQTVKWSEDTSLPALKLAPDIHGYHEVHETQLEDRLTKWMQGAFPRRSV